LRRSELFGEKSAIEEEDTCACLQLFSRSCGLVSLEEEEEEKR
jgi:hypothetical protein